MEKEEAVSPPARMLNAIVRRPGIEPLIFVGLAFTFIWVIRPTGNEPLKISLLAFIILIPFVSNILHRDTLSELGLRSDNLWASTREVGALTAVAALAVVIIGLLVRAGPDFEFEAWRSLALYPFWGLAQQYVMQSFAYRRMREATRRTRVAAALTALLFASLHFPNFALGLATLVGGYFWCRLFERVPNLITLAISHGWLAVLLRYSWPAEWLHNLRIGPEFWTWSP